MCGLMCSLLPILCFPPFIFLPFHALFSHEIVFVVFFEVRQLSSRITQKFRLEAVDFIAMEQQLHEFPVLIEDTNELVTLFLNKEDMKKANKGKINVLFYRDLCNV